MAPHRSYLTVVTPALEAGLIKGMAHITGGGLVDNVPRMLPEGVVAEFDRATWQEPPIFSFLVDRGAVSLDERFQVFNMGLGFVVAVAPEHTNRALALIPESRIVGSVMASDDHPGRVRGLA